MIKEEKSMDEFDEMYDIVTKALTDLSNSVNKLECELKKTNSVFLTTVGLEVLIDVSFCGRQVIRAICGDGEHLSERLDEIKKGVERHEYD